MARLIGFIPCFLTTITRRRFILFQMRFPIDMKRATRGVESRGKRFHFRFESAPDLEDHLFLKGFNPFLWMSVLIDRIARFSSYGSPRISIFSRTKNFLVHYPRLLSFFRFSSGTIGPAVFGLGLRDTCLTILFFNLLCCAPPAYL
jgi:hypothetical protein